MSLATVAPSPIPVQRIRLATAPPVKKQTDIDVVNVAKSVAGLMTQLAEQLIAQDSESRVPVREELMTRLAALVKPGVTIRGMVERAIGHYLDAQAEPADCHCATCRNVMIEGGRPGDRPHVVQTARGPQRVCGDCAEFLNGGFDRVVKGGAE